MRRLTVGEVRELKLDITLERISRLSVLKARHADDPVSA